MGFQEQPPCRSSAAEGLVRPVQFLRAGRGAHPMLAGPWVAVAEFFHAPTPQGAPAATAVRANVQGLGTAGRPTHPAPATKRPSGNPVASA